MDEALLARVEKQAWFHKYPRGWPVLLFVLASLGTIVSVMALERADEQRRELELDRNLTEIASGIQRRASENVALLRATAALFETQESVSSAQFADFAAGVQTDRQSYGGVGLGWARLVRTPDLASFETATRDREHSDFQVFPRSGPDASVTVPIVHLVPQSPDNRSVIGFDMYSESVRRHAIDRSIALDSPVASGKLQLLQGRQKADAAGFIIYMPVYVRQERGKAVKGFVYSPFYASEFLASAAGLYRDRDVDIAIYDGDSTSANLLALRKGPGTADITMSRKIIVANRSWTLLVSDKKSSVLTPLSILTVVFGIVAALLIMAIGWLITKRAAEDREVIEWLQRHSAVRDSLTRELNHRVKNTLANVLSIAALTRRRSRDMDEFNESFTDRIRALSATHDLLGQADWRHAQLGEIVRSELAPYLRGDVSHAYISGPEISLAPNDAMSLGLALHELATNAAKYGAFSTPDGRVYVTWKMSEADRAELLWREEGGPEVREPERRGLGRDLIEKVVAHELGSEISLQFLPEGVRCTLHVPVRKNTEFKLRNRRED